MSQPSWQQQADRQSSVWLDGDDAPVALETETSVASEDGQLQQHLADLMLVSALLNSLSKASLPEREKRIRRVMSAIDGPASISRSPVPMARWYSLAALAAGLMVAVTVTWINFGRNSHADEVLLAVHQVSLRPTDRVYTIRRVHPTTGQDQRPHGKLYLRGRTGFVITSGDVILGRNADQFWLVTPSQQVILSDDFDWIQAESSEDETSLRIMQELSLESRHVPLMQLPSVAELMQSDYDVQWSRTRHGQRQVDLLVGHRQSAKPELPLTIRLWADVDSRIIQRAELDWGTGNAIFLEIEPAAPVPARWYWYQAHCPGEPKVRRVGSKS